MIRRSLLLASLLLWAHSVAAVGSARLVWDRQTLRLIERDGVYGRMIQAADGKRWFVCERNNGISVRQSRDKGITWSEAQQVGVCGEGKLANPELLLSNDGAVLCFYNWRPLKKTIAPYSVTLVRREKDACKWSEPRVLYEAGHEHDHGCWEPAAVQVPSGEIQLFFSNESPYRTSNEQEISLLRSEDGGRTWGRPERISFRSGHRDGMPVPVVLKDGLGVAVAIEDDGVDGAFKPVIVHTTLTDAWHSGTVTGNHAGRWLALDGVLSAKTYAGAPYLRQMATGETVLTFQMSEGGGMEHSRIAVCVGDKRARGFGSPAFPFPVTPGQAQLWASLCVVGERRVVVLSTAAFGGIHGVWSIEGHLEP